MKKQILRELKFNKNCTSPYICQYYGAFMDKSSSTISIAMEFCEGGKALVEVRRWRNGYAAERQKREYAETLIPGLKNAGPTVPNTTHPKEVSR